MRGSDVILVVIVALAILGATLLFMPLVGASAPASLFGALLVIGLFLLGAVLALREQGED